MTKSFTPQMTAAALAIALLSAAGAANATPGYVSASGDPVVTSAYGVCVKTSFWTPSNAVAPCDVVASASVPAPAVVSAPPPAPVAQAAPSAPAPIIEKVALDADVLFEFDKATLRPGGRDELDKLAERIKDAEVESIVTVGYADPIGAEQYNQKLSQERAQSVKQYLAQKGIDEQRMQIEGRGETEQFTQGECKGMKGDKLISCLQPNRRVDVEVRGTRMASGGTGTSSTGATGGASSPAGSAGSSSGPSGAK